MCLIFAFVKIGNVIIDVCPIFNMFKKVASETFWSRIVMTDSFSNKSFKAQSREVQEQLKSVIPQSNVML